MASAFSVSGLSSGIDSKSLIDQLIYGERATARLAESKKAVAQSRLDSVKTMNTKLLALRDAVDGLKQTSTFASRSATVSNESVLTASAGATAFSGSTTVHVKRLASAHQVATAAQPSAGDPLGSSGSITIRAAGATSDTVIAVGDYSLNGIAGAINAANAGVSAGVVHDGNGYRLLLTSTKSGADNAIATLSADGDLAALFASGGITEVAAGQNAQIRLGDPDTGLLIESPTNTLDQAIPGVTLNLKSTGDGINLSVSQDAGSVRDSVQQVLDALNDARAYYNANSRYDTTTKRAGALFNEYDLARQLNAIEQELTRGFADQAEGFRSLADIGITAGADGKFSLDASVFDAKLAKDQSAVASLFLSAGQTIGTTLEGLTRSIDGSMALKQSGLEDAIKAYDERIATLDERLERRRAYYEAQFLAMEKITAQMQSQGTSLTNFISSLSSSSSSKK